MSPIEIVQTILHERMSLFCTETMRSQIMERMRTIKVNRGFFTNERFLLQHWSERVEYLDVCIKIDTPVLVKGIQSDIIGGTGPFPFGKCLF